MYFSGQRLLAGGGDGAQHQPRAQLSFSPAWVILSCVSSALVARLDFAALAKLYSEHQVTCRPARRAGGDDGVACVRARVWEVHRLTGEHRLR
jgi:hypothetical protein